MMQRVYRVGQRVRAPDNRRDLPVLDEVLEREQVVSVLVGRNRLDVLAGDDIERRAADERPPIAPDTRPGEPPPLISSVPVGVTARRS